MTFGAHSLSADSLACVRGGMPVFEGVSFRLASGGGLVVRGPNGSGKSSLLRILGGLMKPSDGTLHFAAAGATLLDEERVRAVHLVGHQGGLTDAMTVKENLFFQTALLGGKRETVSPALERLGLKALAHRMARTLSAGERRRLALARLLSAPRPIWLLDEPTEALDVGAMALIETLLEEHRAVGGVAIAAVHGRAPMEGAAELALVPAAPAVTP